MRSLFFCLMFVLSAFAKDEIRDLYFEIHNDELKGLMERTSSLRKFEKFHCEVYWIKDRLEVVPVADKITKELGQVLKETCERKASIALPFSMKTYLKSFEKKETRDGWTIYTDATGVNDINEVLIKKSKGDMSIIEKRPTGTTRVSYDFGKLKGENVLKKVTLISYEGIQNVTTETKLDYSRKNKFLMPVKAEVSSTQNLVRKEIGDFTRKINETFHFKNYSINESKALIYFSKK